MTNALEEMELTAAQGHIMGYLSRQKDPPCAKDIEEVFHLSHPTVSGILSRLEKKGFIELRTDSRDRRCKRIHTLPKAEEFYSRIYQAIMENEQKIVEGFTPEEQQQFLAYLERAISNMGCRPCNHPQKEEHNE